PGSPRAKYEPEVRMAGGADSVREIESEEPPGPQPFRYPPAQPFTEPDWRRLPGFRNVTSAEWESARWQRLHSIRDVRGLREVFGTRLSDDLAEDIAQDALQRATMTMLVPRSEEHTSELQSPYDLVCRLLLEKKKKKTR